MNDWQNGYSSSFVEHLVSLKEKSLLLPKKIAIVGLGALLAGISVALGFTVLQKLPAVLPIALILIGYLIWFLWRFVSVEYEYSILQGEISIDVIYGCRQRKSLYTTPLSKIEKLGYAAKGDFRDTADQTVFAASEKSNPNTVWALVREDGGSKTLLYFELTEKAEKAIRRENPRIFFGL